MYTKDLHTPAKKIKPFCKMDCFLAKGSNVLYAWCTVMCISIMCRVACVFGLHGQKGDIFPAGSLENGPKDRIHLGCGEERLNPLLLILREQSLSSAVIYLREFSYLFFEFSILFTLRYQGYFGISVFLKNRGI